MTRLRKCSALILASIGVLVLSASPATAAANRYSDPFVIRAIEVVPGGYNVFPETGWPGSAANDPAGCVDPLIPFYSLRVANLTLEDRENIAKTILSAYLAGRKVQLYVHGTTCNGISPYYYGVMITND